MRYVIVGLVLLLSGCAGLWTTGTQAPVAAAVPTPEWRIVGFVYVDVNANGVLDANETYIGNAVVTAQAGESVLTQATQGGWYGFVGLVDGEWQVSATAAGYSCETRSVTVAGGKATAHVPCRLGAPAGTPTATVTPPLPTPTTTVTPVVGLAAQICPDASPLCVQVWLGMGSGARWWSVCPEGRSQVSRFCLSTVGQWFSLP